MDRYETQAAAVSLPYDSRLWDACQELFSDSRQVPLVSLSFVYFTRFLAPCQELFFECSRF